MPSLAQWSKFLGGCTVFLGGGTLFTIYGPPTDEEFLKKISPEAREQAMKYRDLRHRADEIMAKKIQENPDKPAWLQGNQEMRKFERNCYEQARKEIESEQKAQALDSERQRLKTLAQKER